jgi:hypothetical protein
MTLPGVDPKRYEAEVARYKHEKEDIKKEAEKWEESSKEWNHKSDEAMHQHHQWALATTAEQIAISLAAITLLTRKKWMMGRPTAWRASASRWAPSPGVSWTLSVSLAARCGAAAAISLITVVRWPPATGFRASAFWYDNFSRSGRISARIPFLFFCGPPLSRPSPPLNICQGRLAFWRHA